MNKLRGNIESIEVSGNLSIVSILINHKTLLKSIVIETPETASYLKKGAEIIALFKETEVVIGIEEKLNISIQNQISGIISKIEKGNLLSEITIDIGSDEVIAIIASSAIEQLKLQQEMKVTAMIKLNEIMLSK